MRKFLGLAAIAALSACNSEYASQATTPVADPDASKYHEAAFSFDSASGAFAARSAAASAKFTKSEYVAALQDVAKNLESSTYRAQLQKPLDFVCDDVLLAMYQEHGNVYVGDSLVLDKDILKGSCKYTGESNVDSISSAKSAGRAATIIGANWNYGTEAVDRQYPYKMIGTSWDNFNAYVYKSTGGETSFQKYRRKYFTSAWWALDADHIGVRIYLFNNYSIQAKDGTGTTEISVLNRSTSDFYNGSSSVSKRDFAVGITVNGTFNSTIPNVDIMKTIQMPNPREVNNQLTALQNKSGENTWVYKAVDFSKTGVTNIYGVIFGIANGLGYPNIGPMPANVSISGAVVSLHSVDHGNMKFRAMSASGLKSTVVTNGYNSLDFVTW